jgi:hypothetical protein
MRNFLILIFAVSLFSCKSSVPGDVLPPKKMQAVLWDVLQANEMAEYYGAADSTFKSLSKNTEYYQQVFAIHKISKEDFTRSLSYYENHPSRLKPILDSLQSSIQRLDKADTIAKPGPPIVVDTNLKKRLPLIKRH